VTDCLRGKSNPNEDSNIGVMRKESTDEAIVVMKREAEEDKVTYLRVTLLERAKERKDEGRNMLT
jgi:hypothetical protein